MALDDSDAEFLSGGGIMGALMRAHDWSESPLGPPETWPQSLRTVVSLLLNSKFPMFIAWGPELAFLYNDGYLPIFGAKHPQALGQPFAKVWSDIWSDISPLVDRALAGEATFHENLPLLMHAASAIPKKPGSPSPTAPSGTRQAASAGFSAPARKQRAR